MDARSNVFIFYPLSLRYFSRKPGPDRSSAAARPDADDDNDCTTSATAANSRESSLHGVTYLCSRPSDLAHETSYVRVNGLVPDVIDARDCSRPCSDDASRIVLRRVATCIPMTFNLYVLIPRENSARNLDFLQREIARFLLMQVVCGDPVGDTSARGESRRTGSLSCKLELVMQDVFSPLGSLYDLADLFAAPSALHTTGNYMQSTSPATDFSNLCDLYAWRFDVERTFRRVHKHLSDNVSNWSNVFQLPVLFDDDSVRFSFDILVEQRDRLSQMEKNRIRADLMAKLGKNSDFLLTVDNVTSKLSSRADASLNEDILREYTMDSLNEQKRTAGQQQQQQQQPPSSSNSDHDGLSSSRSDAIHLYSCFAFGEWCLLRDNVVLRVDREIFDRVVASHDALRRAVAEHPAVGDALWQTPCVFLPNVIWDVETISARPGTLPRGVNRDEKLVSVAVTVDRNAAPYPTADATRPSCNCFIFVLVPHPISSAEFSDISSLALFERQHRERLPFPVVDEPRVFCYREERAMLVDVVAFLSSQPLLFSALYSLRPEAYSRYADLACFVVGHNTVGYDFLFLHNRCTFFALNSVAAHMTRNVRRYGVPEISNLYTFNESQLCLDTMLFLMTRMRHLPAFDLASVLGVYRCDLVKGSLDARSIRFFYNSLADERESRRLGYDSAQRRLAYFRDFLRYNLYDCLSLSDLLSKLSFAVFANTLMQYFHAPFNTSCYCGNSRLLPNLIIGDMLAHGREFLTVRRQANLSLVSSNAVDFDALFTSLRSLLLELSRSHPSISAQMAVQVFPAYDYHEESAAAPSSASSSFGGGSLDSDTVGSTASSSLAAPPRRSTTTKRSFTSCSSDDVHTNISLAKRNAQNCFYGVQRVLQFSRNLHASLAVTNDDDGTAVVSADHFAWTRDASALSRNEQLMRTAVPLCERESDLLRVDEKTYIGGLNYADPCHLKNPFLMDYNSFYPSIIRHYQLDFNNVAVFSVAKLLMLARSLQRLELLLASRTLRVFDYTGEADTARYVNTAVFADPSFADVYTPLPHCRREWYSGVEMTSVRLLVASTKHLTRRVLVVWNKNGNSTVARIVTDALARRAVWKKLRKANPADRVLESRELMEKLLANGTYGYLNFSRSVIFSRATAAAVTLLCRNAFARTRFIIESDELMRRFDDRMSDRFRAVVNYIDTDGCIVSFADRSHNNATAAATTAAANSELVVTTAAAADNSSAHRLFTLNCSLDRYLLASDRETCVDFDAYAERISAAKDRYVDLVNDMLDMQHVRLAAEENRSVAASVFGRKKYTLYKLNRPSLADPSTRFLLKKTGFEKNAPAPIKLLYDRLLRNVMAINHVVGLNNRQRFLTKIVDHRAFLYALFDSLHELWRDALRDGRVAQFATKIPLNVRATGGKLAEFITTTLREHQYDPGDRVQVLRVYPISGASLDRRPRLTSSLTNLSTVVYNVADSRIILLDELKDHLDDFFPDLRYFLGGHLTYMYQCVEGYKTLRSRNDLLDSAPQVEPIAWLLPEHRDRLFDAARARCGFDYGCATSSLEPPQQQQQQQSRSPEPDLSPDDALVKLLCNDSTMCLRSLNAISSFFYSTWMWERVLRDKHRAHFGPSVFHAYVWREMDDARLASLLTRSAKLLESCTAIGLNDLQTLAPDQYNTVVCPLPDGGSRRVRFVSPFPLLFADHFFRKWLCDSDEQRCAIDESTRSTFFTSSDLTTAAIGRFFRHRVVLYRSI